MRDYNNSDLRIVGNDLRAAIREHPDHGPLDEDFDIEPIPPVKYLARIESVCPGGASAVLERFTIIGESRRSAEISEVIRQSQELTGELVKLSAAIVGVFCAGISLSLATDERVGFAVALWSVLSGILAMSSKPGCRLRSFGLTMSGGIAGFVVGEISKRLWY